MKRIISLAMVIGILSQIPYPAEASVIKFGNLNITLPDSVTITGAEVGRATFSKGSGAFSVRALAYEKPEDGITKVNFLATCTQGSKVGKSEKTITVFVP